jgi:glutathione S-transferase
MIKIHDSKLSGNAWKIRILLGNLGIPFERVTYALPEGKTYTPEFLGKNPLGKVPMVELDDGQSIFESDAILYYFAEGTDLFPRDRLARARVLQWMFFEQNEVMLNLSLPRFWIGIKKAKTENIEQIKVRHEAGYKSLAIMDAHLKTRKFFVDDLYSIADISLYPYAALAHEGEYEMERFPNILAWFERIRAQPGYIPLIVS